MMRGFLKQLVLFALPLMALAAALLLYNAPRKYQYEYLKEDCSGKGRWMYNRIFEQHKPANLVFIGTSRMLRAVNDSLLEHQLDSAGMPLKVLNAGHCRIGRDLETMIGEDIINEVLAIKPGSRLVIEIHEKEDVAPHPVFYCLARPSDYLLPESFINQQYFSTIYDAGLLRLQYLRNQFWQFPPSPQLKSSNGSSRFGVFETNHIADVKDMAESKQRCAGRTDDPASNWNNFEMQYSKAWLERLIIKAKEKNCPVTFLFLPPYGCNNIKPREAAYYKQFGDIWLPPDSIFNKPENWSDHDHFNSSGANEIAKWMVGILLDTPAE